MNLSKISNEIHKGEEIVTFGEEKVMVVNFGFSYGIAVEKGKLSLYDAARGIWYVEDDDLKKKESAKYVVAWADGFIRGVFEIEEWYCAESDKTGLLAKFKDAKVVKQNFSDKKKWIFFGKDAKQEWVGHKCFVIFDEYAPGKKKKYKFYNC